MTLALSPSATFFSPGPHPLVQIREMLQAQGERILQLTQEKEELAAKLSATELN